MFLAISTDFFYRHKRKDMRPGKKDEVTEQAREDIRKEGPKSKA